MITCYLLLAMIAQEIDTVHYRGRSTFSRVESDAEQLDFQAIQRAPTAALRRALADDFLKKYPQSWLLAGAYQAAASASLELNDRLRAVEEGRLSLRLLPENAPLLVVMAQVEMSLGQPTAAARDARDALLWLHLFAVPGGIKDADWRKIAQTLDEDARAILAKAGGKPQVFANPERIRSTAKFAGSDACKNCHAAVHEAWRKTGMASMLSPIAQATLLADFSQPIEYSNSVRAGGGTHPYFELTQPNGTWKRYRVDYVIGSKWQQAYATKLGDERLFVFPIQYNALNKKWINYWATIDPPGSERADPATFARLSSATSYQRNCAACHTSQLRLLRLDDVTMQRAAFQEPGINREMCHGPSAKHAASPETPVPLRFSKLDHVEATLICGQCHRQSALRNLGAKGEMNYTNEQPYYERLLSQPLSEFGARAFYRDGRLRETTFIGEAFMRSACFRRGTAQCASCHDPHPRDAGHGNPTSLKFRDNPDQMCVQCHLAIGAQRKAHTRHVKSRCMDCHMPSIMNALGFRAASHQIDDIPRADFAKRFGPQGSPNACLLCHKDESVDWLDATLRDWKAGSR